MKDRVNYCKDHRSQVKRWPPTEAMGLEGEGCGRVGEMGVGQGMTGSGKMSRTCQKV